LGISLRLGLGLLLAVLAGWCVVVWAWEPSVLALTVDDAFYDLVTARNAAMGRGLTFDGGAPTNGFHPLWVWALVPVARAVGASTDAYVRVALSLGIVLTGAAGVGMASVLERGKRGAFLAALALLLTCPWGTKIFVNGLESALEAAAIALFVRVAASLDEETRDAARDARRAVGLGLAGAALVLARLDAMLLVGFVAVRMLRRPARASIAAFAAGAMSVVLGAWAIAELMRVGHVVPISAAIKGYPTSHAVLRFVLVGAALLACGWGVRRAADSERWGGLAGVTLVGYVASETVASLVLRGVVVPEIWYLVPHALLACVLVATVGGGARARTFAVAAIAPLVISGVAWQRRLDPASYGAYVATRSAARWVERETPSRTRVAAWDAGIVGGYAGRDVHPLDGHIGSWAFKERYLDRSRIPEYLVEAPIDVVVQGIPLAEAEGVDRRYDVPLSGFRVLHAACGRFLPVSARAPVDFVALVLVRSADGLGAGRPTLGEAARSRTLCP